MIAENKFTEIDEVVENYFIISEQIKKLEKQLKDLRPTLEMHIVKETNTVKLVEATTIRIGSFVATLTPAARETFNLKDAKLSLNNDLLQPFMSTNTYTMLKVQKVIK